MNAVPPPPTNSAAVLKRAGVLSKRHRQVLDKLYYSVSSPYGFRGIEALREGAKKVNGLTIDTRTIRKYLQSQKTWYLFTKKRKRYPRNSTVSPFSGYLWSFDIMEMAGYEGVRYALVGVDSFSKYVVCKPMERKNSECVIGAFKAIFTDGHKFVVILTDHDLALMGPKTAQFLKARGVHCLQPDSSDHAYLAEKGEVSVVIFKIVVLSFCFLGIQMIKERLVRIMYYKKTKEWVPFIKGILKGLNNRKQKILGGRSAAEIDHTNTGAVYKLMRDRQKQLPKKEATLRVNDIVVISKVRRMFEKPSMSTSHQDERFRIIKVDKSLSIPTYRIATYDNSEKLLGRWYQNELTKIDPIHVQINPRKPYKKRP